MKGKRKGKGKQTNVLVCPMKTSVFKRCATMRPERSRK
jgi:hypothetical protein